MPSSSSYCIVWGFWCKGDEVEDGWGDGEWGKEIDWTGSGWEGAATWTMVEVVSGADDMPPYSRAGHKAGRLAAYRKQPVVAAVLPWQTVGRPWSPVATTIRGG